MIKYDLDHIDIVVSHKCNMNCLYVSAHPEYQTLIKDFEDKTCIFESIFPKKDPHIVVYENPGLYLTGILYCKTVDEYVNEKVLSALKIGFVPVEELVE